VLSVPLLPFFLVFLHLVLFFVVAPFLYHRARRSFTGSPSPLPPPLSLSLSLSPRRRGGIRADRFRTVLDHREGLLRREIEPKSFLRSLACFFRPSIPDTWRAEAGRRATGIPRSSLLLVADLKMVKLPAVSRIANSKRPELSPHRVAHYSMDPSISRGIPLIVNNSALYVGFCFLPSCGNLCIN